jgi:uncharacterized membrane protein YkgB
MNNFYFSLTAILGAVTLVLCLVVLIPQGMWIYLVGVVWGTFVLTLSLMKLKDSPDNEKPGINYI